MHTTEDLEVRRQEIHKLVSTVAMYRLNVVKKVDLCGHCGYGQPPFTVLAHFYFSTGSFSEETVVECRLTLFALIHLLMQNVTSEIDEISTFGTINSERRTLTIYVPRYWASGSIDVFNDYMEVFGKMYNWHVDRTLDPQASN